jgi:hypothetical protein
VEHKPRTLQKFKYNNKKIQAKIFFERKIIIVRTKIESKSDKIEAKSDKSLKSYKNLVKYRKHSYTQKLRKRGLARLFRIEVIEKILVSFENCDFYCDIDFCEQ